MNAYNEIVMRFGGRLSLLFMGIALNVYVTMMGFAQIRVGNAWGGMEYLGILTITSFVLFELTMRVVRKDPILRLPTGFMYITRFLFVWGIVCVALTLWQFTLEKTVGWAYLVPAVLCWSLAQVWIVYVPLKRYANKLQETGMEAH